MKRSISIILMTICAVISCNKFDDSKIWDKLNDHESRLMKLELLCSQYNTNIESLRSSVEAIQKNDFVTTVMPVTNNGKEIGYVIAFSSGKSITIYHGEDGRDGQDGQNGQNGQDGYTPVIGVRSDADGRYYWTLDGDWLRDTSGNKLPVTGEDGKDGIDGTDGQDGKDGQDGEAGKDGVNGQDGKDGEDGKDGITPQLKIENDYWFVSYDSGNTWIQLGYAVGQNGEDGKDGIDGVDGTDGKDGDSFFSDIDVSSEDYVIFILSDGTQIQIPRCPTAAVVVNLGTITETSATFVGTVAKKSLDLKVTIYYSKDSNLDKYVNDGNISLVSFPEETFSLDLTDLQDATAYYYFVEILADGVTTYSDVKSFTTDGVPSNQIWYTATEKVEPVSLTSSLTGQTMVVASNVYDQDTQSGIITFTAAVDVVPEKFFYGKSAVTSVTLPKEVDFIEDYAFTGCAMTSFTIPENVKDIGSGALYSSTLKELNILTKSASCFNGTSEICNNNILEKITGPYASEDGRFCISDGILYLCALADVTQLNIPDGVTEIAGMLQYCNSITSINIPASVKKISGIFIGFENLTSVNIAGDGLEIGENDNSFILSCEALEEITGPLASSDGNSLVVNNHLVTAACSGLTEYSVPEGVETIAIYAYNGCSDLKTLTFPSTLSSIGYPPTIEELDVLNCLAPTPPFTQSMSSMIAETTKIYVPSDSYLLYISEWSEYEENIYPIDGEFDYNYDYIDESGTNYGKGTEFAGVVWAPVNCGYDKTDYPYGKLYQWGRYHGHGYSGAFYVDGESTGDVSDSTTPTIVSGPVYFYSNKVPDESANNFYSNTSSPFDWTSSPSSKLWNSGTAAEPVKTSTDPCPTGWRVPTYAELNTLLENYGSLSITTNDEGIPGYWVNSADYTPMIFLPLSGSYTRGGYGNGRGKFAGYWSSGVTGSNSYILLLIDNAISLSDNNRAVGYNVRCVKQYNE